MYTIYCELLIENTKKWDLTLHSGIVEMKATKKIEIHVYMYVLHNKILKTKSLAKKKVVPETILKFLKNIVASNLQ